MDFLVELLTLDLDVGRRDGLHVGLGAAEGDSSAPDGVLVLVRVDPGVDNSAEEIIEDLGENLRVQHSVESTDKNCLLRIQLLVGILDEVAIVQYPRNNLYFFASHSSAGYFEVVSSIARRALREQTWDVSLVIKNYVDISFRW